MSFIDVAIPGIIGLVLFLWPQSMFIWSQVKLGPKEIRLLRFMGVVLVLIAVIYLVSKLVRAQYIFA